jgi:hypothetical protein
MSSEQTVAMRRRQSMMDHVRVQNPAASIFLASRPVWTLSCSSLSACALVARSVASTLLQTLIRSTCLSELLNQLLSLPFPTYNERTTRIHPDTRYGPPVSLPNPTLGCL